MVLLVIAIPWYWAKDSNLFFLGLPVWVIFALLVSLITSLFTAWNLLSDEEGED